MGGDVSIFKLRPLTQCVCGSNARGNYAIFIGTKLLGIICEECFLTLGDRINEIKHGAQPVEAVNDPTKIT